MVGQLRWLECGKGWTQTPQERQAEKMVWWPLCEGAAWMYGSAVEDTEWAS